MAGYFLYATACIPSYSLDHSLEESYRKKVRLQTKTRSSPKYLMEKAVKNLCKTKRNQLDNQKEKDGLCLVQKFYNELFVIFYFYHPTKSGWQSKLSAGIGCLSDKRWRINRLSS